MKNSISILGSGWLGMPLAKSLQEQGYSVLLSTRHVEKVLYIQAQGIEPHIVDISSPLTSMQPFLQSDTLIINITCKELNDYLALLREIEVSPIKQVLFISSTSVYASDAGLCKESDPLDTETKLRKIERLFADNNHFQCSVIRFAGLVGPKRHPGRFFATGKVIRDSAAKVNLIHLHDCIGIIQSVLAQAAWGEVFNGCADNHPTKHKYYSEMATLLGYPEPVCLKSENSASKVVCNEKVKSQLGYQFVYPDLYQIKC